jgi:hypothetical protein
MNRDQRRYDALQRIGCIACYLMGYPGIPCDVHHIVDKGYRKHSGGNSATIGLCPYHHRGQPLEGRTAVYMRHMYGPSLALEAKEFSYQYGSQRDLLAKVNELLKESTHVSADN